MVVLAFLAIFSTIQREINIDIASVTVGIGLGWFGHVIAMRRRRTKESIEFRPWEVNLARAQNQLENVRHI